MDKTEQALEYMSKGAICSQSVLLPYAEELGLTRGQALQLTSCMGGGIQKGEVCGAVLGALMVLGLKYGQYDLAAPADRIEAEQASEEFLAEFAARNGSWVCRELLGCDLSTPEGKAYAMEHRLFTEFCPKMVASAVDILEDME